MKKIVLFLLVISFLFTSISVFAETTTDKVVLREKLSTEQGLTFLGNVPNDATGMWRLSEYTSESTPDVFALEYYKAYFDDDKEIHAIINKQLGITTCVVYDNGMLFVTVFNYHQDEEKKTIDLFHGKPVSDYVINVSTGDIERKSLFLWWQNP